MSFTSRGKVDPHTQKSICSSLRETITISLCGSTAASALEKALIITCYSACHILDVKSVLEYTVPAASTAGILNGTRKCPPSDSISTTIEASRDVTFVFHDGDTQLVTTRETASEVPKSGIYHDSTQNCEGRVQKSLRSASE